MVRTTENQIEKFAIELFEKLGYQYVYAQDIAPNSETPLPITISGEMRVDV
jgi:type I restriction enzyme R subunit